MESSKTIWKSRMFWINLSALALMILEDIAGSGLLKDHPGVVLKIMQAYALGNIVLRAVTGQPVTLSGK